MKEPLVNFKTAKLAKKKGFPQTFLHSQYINLKKGEWKLYSSTDADELDNSIGIGGNIRCSAPTQSLLQKWLREKHSIHVTPKLNDPLAKRFDEAAGKVFKQWKWYMYTNINDSDLIYEFFSSSNNFNTFEEAFEEGLLEALKLI